MNPLEMLEALSKKWRKDVARVGEWYGEEQALEEGACLAREECADELDAALSALKERIKTMTTSGFAGIPETAQPSNLPAMQGQAARTSAEGARLRFAGGAYEQILVQLAGCLTAAEGATTNPAKPGDYGWSLAYQRTLELRKENERLKADLDFEKDHSKMGFDALGNRNDELKRLRTSHAELVEALLVADEILERNGIVRREVRDALARAEALKEQP